MNILVVGGSTTNKGAYLMLLAVLHQAREHIDNANLVISPTIGNTAPLEAIGYKRLDFPMFHSSATKALDRVLKYPKIMQLAYKLFKKVDYYGEVPIRDIDVVVDVSGFAYSDQFGAAPLEGLKKQVDFYQKRGINYIIMPMALGPFSETQKLAKAAFENIDLIHARDTGSYEFIKELLPSKENIFKAPDITLSLSTDRDLPFSVGEKGEYCCIVPNEKMIDKARDSWRSNYTVALSGGIDQILEGSTMHILLLVHNDVGSKDEKLTKEIYKAYESNSRVTMCQHDDPLVLKKIIKEASFIIGSRFHSLASALSSDTPCISTSWAHKYELLFEDYNMKEYSHREYDQGFHDSIDSILDFDNRKKLSNAIQLVNKSNLIDNSAMWSRISKQIVSVRLIK